MSKIIWDQEGQRFYETGVDHGVLYPKVSGAYPRGVAWNGLISIEEAPTGGEASAIWADNIKYLNLISNEDFGCTINAYTYPDEFEECDGTKSAANGLLKITSQTRKVFGFTYRTLIGNDSEGTDYGYEIHIVYGCTAAPSSKTRSTVNDSPESAELSWTVSTTPEIIKATDSEGKPFKPTAHIKLESANFKTDAQKAKLTAFENLLYGTDGTVSYTEFSGSTFESDVTYYERSGVEGAYVYTPTADTEPAQGKTYYTKSETGGTDAYLPLPDAIITLLTAA